jgi:peptidoglycan/LPS O-acetylase OafA/YrhL
VSPKIHFPGLNGLRFYAALLVVVSHVEVAKTQVLGVGNVFQALPIALDVGSLAVRFFFVLSGFLITYLLLAERTRRGEIRLGDFYARRTLRIAPLYYLIVLLAFTAFPLLFPADPAWNVYLQPRTAAKLALYAAFLPNVGLLPMPIVPGAGHLWSIGVEQQFYALWPLLVKAVRGSLVPALIALLVAKTGLLFLLDRAFAAGLAASLPPAVTTFYKWTFFPIEYMAIGAIGAAILFERRERVLRLLTDRRTEIAALALLPAVFVVAIPMPSWLIGALFLVLVLNVAANERALVRLDDPVHRRLGDLSYGVYMFHPLILFAVLSATRHAPALIASPWALAALLYATVLPLTYAAAALSHRWFEGPFLAWKESFSRVPSRPA